MPIMKAFDLVNWIIAAVALLHKITKVGSGRATVKARGQVATAKYKTHNTNYKIQNTKYIRATVKARGRTGCNCKL